MTPHDELGRRANFAQTGIEDTSKYKKRLSQNRSPSTRESTTSWVNWDYMGDVLGQPFDVTKIPISKLEQMQRDPILAFGLMFIKVPLVRAPWYIKSSDAKRAAFIDNALRRIYGRFILAYSNSFAFGYSPMVKRFEYDLPDWTYIDKDDPDQTEVKVWDDDSVQALVWKPFLALNPRSAYPHWTAKGEFAGIDYTSGGLGPSTFPSQFPSASTGKPADIPLDWALWATNEKDSMFGSLWGYPRLGYAYRYWWSYWYKFGLADRAFEKWADPPVLAFHPAVTGLDETGEEVNYSDAALALAERIRSGANASMPSSVVKGFDEKNTNIREWWIEQMKSEANFNALHDMFKYLDVQKLRAMMVPEQSLIEGNSTGSKNVAEKYGDIFQESQAVVMQEIDDQINRYLIPQLLEANFGPGGPTCTKVTNGFDAADVETMRQIVGGIANADSRNMPVDIRAMLEKLGVPTLSPKAFQNQLDKLAEEQEQQFAREMKAKAGNAGVNSQGLYYDDRPSITLSDDESGTLKKVFDKLFGRDNDNNNNDQTE